MQQKVVKQMVLERAAVVNQMVRMADLHAEVKRITPIKVAELLPIQSYYMVS